MGTSEFFRFTVAHFSVLFTSGDVNTVNTHWTKMCDAVMVKYTNYWVHFDLVVVIFTNNLFLVYFVTMPTSVCETIFHAQSHFYEQANPTALYEGMWLRAMIVAKSDEVDRYESSTYDSKRERDLRHVSLRSASQSSTWPRWGASSEWWTSSL